VVALEGLRMLSDERQEEVSAVDEVSAAQAVVLHMGDGQPLSVRVSANMALFTLVCRHGFAVCSAGKVQYRLLARPRTPAHTPSAPCPAQSASLVQRGGSNLLMPPCGPSPAAHLHAHAGSRWTARILARCVNGKRRRLLGKIKHAVEEEDADEAQGKKIATIRPGAGRQALHWEERGRLFIAQANAKNRSENVLIWHPPRLSLAPAH